MHALLGDQGNHTHTPSHAGYGSQPSTQLCSSLSPRGVCHRDTALPGSGATILHKMVTSSPNSWMDFTAPFKSWVLTESWVWSHPDAGSVGFPEGCHQQNLYSFALIPLKLLGISVLGENVSKPCIIEQLLAWNQRERQASDGWWLTHRPMAASANGFLYSPCQEPPRLKCVQDTLSGKAMEMPNWVMTYKVHCPDLPFPLLPPSIHNTLFLHRSQTPELLPAWCGSSAPPSCLHLGPSLLPSSLSILRACSLHFSALCSRALQSACPITGFWGVAEHWKSEKGKAEFCYFLSNHPKMFQCRTERDRDLHLANTRVSRTILKGLVHVCVAF